MNDNNELDALFARIKDDLYEPCPECNGTGVDTGSSDRCSVCDGKEFIPNHDAQAALATLRTKLAALEAERDALLKNIELIADNYAYRPNRSEAEEYSEEASAAFGHILDIISISHKQS